MGSPAARKKYVHYVYMFDKFFKQCDKYVYRALFLLTKLAINCIIFFVCFVLYCVKKITKRNTRKEGYQCLI